MRLDSDIVETPEWVIELVAGRFDVDGRVLDPCAGDQRWSKYFPITHTCEILDGSDFYEVNWSIEYFDWVVGNPPYGDFSDFLRHTFTVTDNILYLIPANKVFNSYRMIKEVQEYGGIVEIFVISPGSKMKFPIGFAIAAVHIKKGYTGETRISIAQTQERSE